jgi:ferredoxin
MKNGDNKFVYVDHMLTEHRRLDQLVRRTISALPTWEEMDAPDWLPRMTNGLVAIRTELAHHFHDEEQGGCLEEAVARCPQLSAEVQRIEGEHEQILTGLNELIDRCQCTAKLTPQQSLAIEQELRQIVRELRAHEALENRIIQLGFGVCLENEDMSEPITAEATPRATRSASV